MPPNGPLCIASASSREVCCSPINTFWMNLPLIRSSSVCLCVVLIACRIFAVEFEAHASGSTTVSLRSVDTARRAMLSCHGAWKRVANSACPLRSLHHARCMSLPNAPLSSWLLWRSCPCCSQKGVTSRFGVGSPYGALW